MSLFEGSPEEATAAGEAAVLGGKHSEAQGLFSHVLETIPHGEPGAQTLRARCLVGTAQCEYQKGNHQACKEAATKALLLTPAVTAGTVHCSYLALRVRISADESLGNSLSAEHDCGRILLLAEDPLFAAHVPNAEAVREEVRAKVAAFEAERKRAEADVMQESTFLGCKHYTRRCRMYCPECDVLSNCRLCHDERAGHVLDRFAVSRIQCGFCQTDQPPSKECQNEDCTNSFADYYCDTCHLWVDIPPTHKENYIWHCADCGLCRVAPHGLSRDDYFHCSTCNMCWPKGAAGERQGHSCVVTDTTALCSCCLELLHSSINPVSPLPCGHQIHVCVFFSPLQCTSLQTPCRRNMVLSAKFACPVCKKTFAPEVFDTIRREVAFNVMPKEYKKKRVEILCNDCLEKSEVC